MNGLRPRVIVSLLLSDGGLVKTRGFSDPKYIGDPINAVRIFNEKSCDELMLTDINCSAKNTKINFSLIEKIAKECRMPLCYGGGIDNVRDAARLIDLGVEKVALSSTALRTPELVGEISAEIGAQSTVVVIDVKKISRLFKSAYCVYTHNGKQDTKFNLQDAIELFDQLEVGEFIINSIDRDGALGGYDSDLARLAKSLSKCPVTMLGGAGSLTDFQSLLDDVGLIGLAAGSLFVFKGKYRAVLINYPSNSDRISLRY